MRHISLAVATILALVLWLHDSVARAAELTVIAPSLMVAVFDELKPQFERDTGHKLVITFSQTAGVKREVDAGNAFDVIVSATAAVDGWVKEGKIVGTTRAAVANVGLGVGVRRGASKPDIASAEAFKTALLKARSVAHGAESASAIYFSSLLERLSIAEEMKPRLRPVVGGAVVKLIASGEAELGIATVPTILAAPGVELVGPLPRDLQTYVSFSAGVTSGAKEPKAAESLINYLRSAAAIEVMKAKGLEAGTTR